MKEEGNIITMDGQGNISLPNDVGVTVMVEWEVCELLGVIAPTVRARIKALYKNGALSIYDIRYVIHLSDRCSAEAYGLKAITILAFRAKSFGVAKVRRALLERVMYGRREKTAVPVSVISSDKPSSHWKT